MCGDSTAAADVKRVLGSVRPHLMVTDPPYGVEYDPAGGHLFQGRFSSVILDEENLMLAARYMALNPVRARLVQRPQDWAWSSLGAHLGGRDDGLVTVAPLLERLGDVTALIDTGPEEAALAHLRAAEATGRPLGSDDFVTRLEDLMQRRPLSRA